METIEKIGYDETWDNDGWLLKKQKVKRVYQVENGQRTLVSKEILETLV